MPSPETAGNKKTISSSVSGQYGSKPNDGQIAVGSLGHSTIGAAGTSGAAAFGVSAPSYLSNAPDGATLNTLDKVSGANESPVGAGNGNTSSASRGQPISLPLSRVVTLGSLRVGFNSGHTIVPNSDPDALLIAARQLDVDILSGEELIVEAYQLEGKFFVNPGSATGAFYTGWPDNEDLEDEEGEGEESTKKRLMVIRKSLRVKKKKKKILKTLKILFLHFACLTFKEVFAWSTYTATLTVK